MFCDKCGASLATDAAFCHKCGTAVQRGAANGDRVQPGRGPQPASADRLVNCPDCHGHGEVRNECQSCIGGWVSCHACNGLGITPWVGGTCRVCQGTGREPCFVCGGHIYSQSPCNSCDGAGQVSEVRFRELVKAKADAARASQEAARRQAEATTPRPAPAAPSPVQTPTPPQPRQVAQPPEPSRPAQPVGRQDVTINREAWDLLMHAPSPRELSVLQGHLAPVTSLVFTSDGRSLVSAGTDGTVRVWDVLSSRCLQVLTPPGIVQGLCRRMGLGGLCGVLASSDARHVGAANERSVYIWGLGDGQSTYRLSDTIAREQAGTHMGPMALVPREPGTSSLFPATGILSLLGGPRLVFGSGKELRTWPPWTNAAVGTHEKAIQDVAGCDVPGLVASGSWDTTVRLWDIDAKKCLRVIQSHDPKADYARGLVSAVALSPDGKTVAAGIGNGVSCWESATGRLVCTVCGHDNDVRTVVLAKERRVVASVSEDGCAKVWDVTAGACLATLSLRKWGPIALHPDGCRLAVESSDHTIRVLALCA